MIACSPLDAGQMIDRHDKTNRVTEIKDRYHSKSGQLTGIPQIGQLACLGQLSGLGLLQGLL